MNKLELIAAVAEKAELSKKDVENAVKAFAEVVTEELSNGGEVKMSGFGTFSVTERAARVARNPKTGEPVNVPASKAPKFKPSKTFKDEVNQ